MRTRFIAMDNEGVLYDGEPIYLEAVNRVLRKRNLIEVTMKEHVGYIGRTKTEYWEGIRQKYDLSEQIDELISEKDRYHTEILERDALKMLPGVLEFILGAKQHKYPIVVATSADLEHLRTILGKLGIAGYINSIASAEECENGKPSPDVYLLAAERIGIGPCHGLAVEDSRNGMLSAKTAGYKTIVVPTVYTEGQDFSVADLRLSNLKEFDFDGFSKFLQE